MKKTLIALAALAATGAFAQSSVQIVGVLDVGYKNVSNDNSTKNQKGITNNGTATSQFNFKGTEDLGGGVKSGFFFEWDISPQSSIVSNQANNGQALYTGTPFNGEQYLTVNGAFGDIKIGTPNSAALTAGVTAQPFGTALGSGYSAGFARMGTAGTAGLNQYVGGVNAGARLIRHEKSVKYTTPNFSGFSANLEYAAKNDVVAGASASNTNGYTALALNYNNGPLNVIAYHGEEKSPGDAAAGTASMAAPATIVANVLGTNQAVHWNMLAANYTFGPATVYAGYTKTGADGMVGSPSQEDSKSINVAVKYAVTPSVDLAANYLERKSDLAGQAAAPKAKMLGLGADYKLSKMTAVYYRYENIKDIAIAAGAGQNQTVNMVGLRVAF